MKTDWNKVFAEAHLHSWPTATLSISNAEPNAAQKGQGKRNLYREDKAQIAAAAKRYGYREMFHSRSIVSFINPDLKGLAC